MLTCAVLFLALCASAQGRAVNISNTWVLPEEGFPVFYRYFRDRISWYEADAVCQFHHANLVTVDTTAQYDAVRAYLKELDISSAVWVGLIRSNLDGDFTWTDYRGLSGDGYWSSAPDNRAAPLCAAADPAADYRWEARACGGPSIASFICELPVPQWALGNEGCMVRQLPALTVLYLPESASVQLTADCGLAGVKKVQCTGNMKRETLLKGLSCMDSDELSTPSVVSTGTPGPITTDTTANTDQDNLTETATDEYTTTSEPETEAPKLKGDEATAVPYVPVVRQSKANKISILYSQNSVDPDSLLNNNLHSNDIPKLVNNDNYISMEQSEKLEDEKNMHHKMLHDELAKHGNFETIFMQPTDHFVPPLVMAKAKISDDMTVLSLAEKHAQQLAERKLGKHTLYDEYKNSPKLATDDPGKLEIINIPLVVKPVQSNKSKEISKGKNKNGMPKKYNEKYEDPKRKYSKINNKANKLQTVVETSTLIFKGAETTSNQIFEAHKVTPGEDSSMELEVVLKEKKKTLLPDGKINFESASEAYYNFTITENIITTSSTPKSSNTEITINSETANLTNHYISTESPQSTTSEQKIRIETPTKSSKPDIKYIITDHEIVKPSLVNNDSHKKPTQTDFEITTRNPITQKMVDERLKTDSKTRPTMPNDVVTDNSIGMVTVKQSNTFVTQAVDNAQKFTTNTEKSVKTKDTDSSNNNQFKNASVLPTAAISTQHLALDDKMDMVNDTQTLEDLTSMSNEGDAIDDTGSPLLSAASQPLHRPNRSRRPQPPPNKFNPFRILG